MKNLNPNIIPGIHNYCDRWCERCAFTSRCAVYESTSDLTLEQNDIKNKAFWENLSKNFADAFSMLQQAADKHGVEITVPSAEEKEIFIVAEKKKTTKLEKHPLVRASKQYYKQAMALLDNKKLMQFDEKELLQLVELGIKNANDAKIEIMELNDCLEIVQWYIFQINVKFMRAIPLGSDDPNDDFLKSDSDGSAKVALIAVDRCLLAWQKIMHYLPQATDEIIGLLALLQKIQSLGETTFPDARSFKRVGLDD